MQERLLNGLNKKGFTMVELLVAMTMSLVVLVAVYMTFKTQLYSFQLTEQTAPLQQNVRIAKMFLERDIRMAGANMDGVAYPLSSTTVNTLLYPVANDNDNTDGDAGSDELTVVYIDYYAGACGDAPDPAGGDISCDDFPSLTLANTMPASSAIAEIEEEISDAPYSQWDDDCYCNGVLSGVPPSSGDAYRAIITSPDGTSSDIVYIKTVSNNGGGSLDNLGNGPYNGFDNKVLNGYPAGSTISFFSEDSYVEMTYDLVDGNLRRNGATIAENIEDLQFAFGLDTTDDGSVDTWINDVDLDDTQKLQVRMVRINILGRSSKQITGTNTSIRPAIEDHDASTTSDRYKRRQLELTVKVRNLGI
jgi:type IV pilus assembly protein PilW